MSPYFNRRTDECGGSFENRMRFPGEVLCRVRENAGPDMAAASFEGYKFARYIGQPDAPATIGEVYFSDDEPALAVVPAPAA